MQGQVESYPRTAYLLSLIGGILILVFSLIYAAILLAVASVFAGLGLGFGVGLAMSLAAMAVILGVLVLVFAILLKSHPGQSKMYGVLILVFSVISFFGGGGFYIGAILGFIGGILALIWHPPAPVQQAWGQQPMPPVSPPA